MKEKYTGLSFEKSDTQESKPKPALIRIVSDSETIKINPTRLQLTRLAVRV